MKKNKYKKLLLELIRIRETELEISKQYKKQKMRCPIHLSIGQESIPVAICQNLNFEDQLVTAHRSHAHYLAKGGNLKKMISELHGKITGCAKGKGGSMHLIDISANILAAVPIVGSTIPIGVGIAWSNKLKKNKKIVVIFFGDGATEQGVFYESLNFAALHNLRVLFVCENNKYSVYSNVSKRQPANRKIYKVAKSLGIESHHFNDHKLINIFNKSKKLINKIRTQSKPLLIEVDTFRQVEHCGPDDDDNLNYRNLKEINYWKKNCSIQTIEKIFLNRKFVTKNSLNFSKHKIKSEIENAFKFAFKSKFPSKSELKKDIYKKPL